MGVGCQVEQHLVRPVTVVAVVPGPQIEVVAPADPALACPCTLGEHEHLAAVFGAGAELRGDGPPVPVRRHTEAREVDDRRGDVEVIVQAGVGHRLDARPAQDRGDVARCLVGRLMIGVDAEFAEGLAVVGADQHPISASFLLGLELGR